MSLCTRVVFQEADVDSSVVCAMPALLLCSWALYLPPPLFCTSLYASALGAAPALLRSRHARSLVMLSDSTSTSCLYFVVLLWFPNICTNTFIWSEIFIVSTIKFVIFFHGQVTSTDVGKGSPPLKIFGKKVEIFLGGRRVGTKFQLFLFVGFPLMSDYEAMQIY